MTKFEQSDVKVVKPGEKIDIKLNEFDKLVSMLDKAGIPYERDDEDEERKWDSVCGHLTAEDVFQRIKKHYEENKNDNKNDKI